MRLFGDVDVKSSSVLIIERAGCDAAPELWSLFPAVAARGPIPPHPVAIDSRRFR
jgi:hypothetical protein